MRAVSAPHSPVGHDDATDAGEGTEAENETPAGKIVVKGRLGIRFDKTSDFPLF